MVVAFCLSISTKSERTGSTQIEISAKRAFADASVVDLDGSAVAARLIEIPAARENQAVLGDLAADHDIGSSVGNARWDIHAAALIFGDKGVSVGVENLAAECGFPSVFLRTSPNGKLWRILVSVGSFERDTGWLRRARENLDHSAEGIAAVETGGAFLGDLDVGDRLAGDTVPVDPCAERVVERNSILENQSTARAAGAEAAQRYTLSCGIRGAAAGAAEEAEPRDLAQRVIEGESWDGLHF